MRGDHVNRDLSSYRNNWVDGNFNHLICLIILKINVTKKDFMTFEETQKNDFNGSLDRMII